MAEYNVVKYPEAGKTSEIHLPRWNYWYPIKCLPNSSYTGAARSEMSAQAQQCVGFPRPGLPSRLIPKAGSISSNCRCVVHNTHEKLLLLFASDFLKM